MLTIGVEEEFLLLAPATGLPVADAGRIRAAANALSAVATGEIGAELLQAQVEVNTPVCKSLQSVGDHLTRLRAVVGGVAAGAGLWSAACGAAPVRDPVPIPITPGERYRFMADDAGRLVEEQLINGMHVHVGVPDRESGVGVLNRIRLWLPVLVALGAGSPLWDGGDTGFASWRTLIFDRWPVSGPPPVFADAADYGLRAQALVDSGAIRDLGQLYWHARLSERYPTIEIRVLDVQLDVEDSVTLAGLSRALVAQGLREHLDNAPALGMPVELLSAATWQAARRGLDGPLVDPRTGDASPARDVVDALVEYVTPELRAAGDLARIKSGVERLLRLGNSAQRQRRVLASGGLDAVLDLVSGRETTDQEITGRVPCADSSE